MSDDRYEATLLGYTNIASDGKETRVARTGTHAERHEAFVRDFRAELRRRAAESGISVADSAFDAAEAPPLWPEGLEQKAEAVLDAHGVVDVPDVEVPPGYKGPAFVAPDGRSWLLGGPIFNALMRRYERRGEVADQYLDPRRVTAEPEAPAIVPDYTSTEEAWFEANGVRFRLWLPEGSPAFPWDTVRLTIEQRPVPKPMQYRPMIALSGAAGAGKDEAAKVLVQHGYIVGKFAAGVYAAALALDPLITKRTPMYHGDDNEAVRMSELVEKHGWETAKRGFSEVRRTLQRMGTEVGREVIGEDVWVDAAATWSASISEPIVWTDARFPNEVAFVKEQGGLWFHIERPGQETIATSDHASETSLDPYAVNGADYVIENNGTLEDLHERVLAGVRFCKP